MANPLLSLLAPAKRNSAMVFPNAGLTPELPDWSQDASAFPVDDSTTVTADPGAVTANPASDPLAGLLGAGHANDPLKLAAARTAQVQERSAEGLAGKAKPVKDAMAADPYTGDAAQAKDQKAFGQYQDLARFLGPEETQVRDIEQKGKVDLATAPTIAAGKNQIAVERMKSDAERYKADQALAGKNAALAAASTSKFPAAIQSQAINAGATADHLEHLDQEIDDPALQPYIGAVLGRVSDFMQGKLGVNAPDPTTTRKIGQLRQDLILAASGVARAHNQRGATKELLEQFEKDLNAAKDPMLLHGAIDAAKGMMLTYAHPQAFTPAPAASPNAPVSKMLGMTPPPVEWVQGPDGRLVRK